MSTLQNLQKVSKDQFNSSKGTTLWKKEDSE